MYNFSSYLYCVIREVHMHNYDDYALFNICAQRDSEENYMT